MLLNLASIITLEPLIAILKFGDGQLEGGQIQSNLLLWKICHLELNYTENICGNLTLDEYDEINNEVQERANNFLIIKEWLSAAPALVWCLIAGTLLIQLANVPPNQAKFWHFVSPQKIKKWNEIIV